MKLIVWLLLSLASLASAQGFGAGTAAKAAAPCIISTNSDTSLTGWKTCSLPSCQPGGSGTPTATAQTTGNSIGGKTSMLVSQSAQASAQTNVLWPHSAGSCDGANVYTSDFWLYIPSTFAGNSGSGGSAASSFEMDMYNFCLSCTGGGSSTGIRYMYGMQFCQMGSGCPSGVNGWDLCGNDNCAWTYSGQNQALSFDTWHHIIVHNHRVWSEVGGKPCAYTLSGTTYNVPYIYFDDLVIDNTVYPLNQKFCADINPSGWEGVGNQFQIDIGPHSPAYSVGMYITSNTFQAAY